MDEDSRCQTDYRSPRLKAGTDSSLMSFIKHARDGFPSPSPVPSRAYIRLGMAAGGTSQLSHGARFSGWNADEKICMNDGSASQLAGGGGGVTVRASDGGS